MKLLKLRELETDTAHAQNVTDPQVHHSQSRRAPFDHWHKWLGAQRHRLHWQVGCLDGYPESGSPSRICGWRNELWASGLAYDTLLF